MASGGIVILADVSSSMGQRGESGLKIDSLRTALRSIWAETPGCSILAFASDVKSVESPEQIPAPHGGTNLCQALERAAGEQPAQCIVISDGQPDSEMNALIAADLIPGTIDCIFIGLETDREAIAFMRELSERGGGKTHVNDLTRCASLIAPLREVLGLPAPIAL